MTLHIDNESLFDKFTRWAAFAEREGQSHIAQVYRDTRWTVCPYGPERTNTR